MTTTRYYLADQNTHPVLVAWSSVWNTVPVSATQPRRLLTPVPPVSSNGGTAGRPSVRPNSGSAMQGVSDALAAGQLSGTFRAVIPAAYIGTAWLRVVLRLVSGDGLTVRGLLADVTNAAALANGSVNTTTVITGALTPVTAVAGDRIVVEYGVAFPSAGALGGSSSLAGWSNTAVADYPYTAGIVADTRRSWLELILDDPPNPPTGLAAAPDVDTMDLSWVAPVAGAPVDGYALTVDGGAPIDLGNVTTYTLTGLTPGTTYHLELVAYNAAGSSAPAELDATTVTGAAYRVVVRLGSHTWDVLAGDPPEYGPTLPVSFGWTVPEDSLGFPAQPDPDLCPLGLVTADHAAMAGVDIGTTMRVSIYTSAGSSARPLATFRGRVADLEAAPHPLGLAWTLLGVGYTADPGSRQIGHADWPQESGDDRAARIMAEAGYPGWTADPIGTTWEPRTGAATTARAELENLAAAAVTTEGTAWGPARRVLVHPITDADGDLVPATPFAGAAVLRRVDALDFITAGLVNRATTWRRTKLLDATWVRIDHPGGPTTYGDTRGPAYPAQSVSVLDPRELADLILDTSPGYRWLTGQALRLELWADAGPALGVVAQWFYRDPDSEPFPWSGRAVIVEGITQTPDGTDRYAGMLAAATLRLEHTPVGGRLVVEFRLRPEIPADSTVTMRWMDEPPAATWADELATDPTGTWYDYYTTPRP